MRKQTVYLIRHAEAAHNIKEREAVERVKAAKGPKEEQELARKAVLHDESLRDAPLSSDGRSQVQHQSSNLTVLHRVCSSHSMSSMNSEDGSSSYSNNIGHGYEPPKIVLVSPLRRALMTATDLFHRGAAPPKFVALEALREKRTGFAADERSSVEVLEQEFPHVDFSDVRNRNEDDIAKGEDNVGVRARGRIFMEGYFANNIQEDSVALVTHKGWLREHRKHLKSLVDEGRLAVDFDIDEWDQTLYGNAEIRVAQFGWNENNQLCSIVSRSVENVIASVVSGAIKHLVEKTFSAQSLQALANKSMGASDTDDFSDSDSDSDDDSDNGDEDDCEDGDDFLFYDFDMEQEEQLVPVGEPLTPRTMSAKLSGMQIQQPSPSHVSKHISFPEERTS